MRVKGKAASQPPLGPLTRVTLPALSDHRFKDEKVHP